MSGGTAPDGAGREPAPRRVRVKDAATLIVVDRAERSVLMGRRSQRHAFMPGLFVFPGGSVDPGDARVRLHACFDPVTQARLVAAMRGGRGEARARALGVAAVRETFEETGIIVGRKGGTTPSGAAFLPFSERGVGIDLSALRFLMRAITPPGRPRRFDARFLVVDRSHVADTDPNRIGPDAELEEIGWIRLGETAAKDLPRITRIVLDELARRLDCDPDFSPEAPVPFLHGNRRDLL